MTTQTPKRILILGGGFGGLYTALELEKTLARDSDVEVTLVNRENFFLFTPMLHEVAASDLDLTDIVNPVRKLLRRVKFFEGEHHQQILSHNDPAALVKWLDETNDCKGVTGIMYTTCDGNWGPLEKYISAAKEWQAKHQSK